MTEKIAIIGDIDTTIGFRLAGIPKTSAPVEAAAIRKALIDYTRDQEVALIIITERKAEQARDTIEELTLRPYPVIVEIPDKKGRLEDKTNPLQRLVKRAIGVELEGF